MTETRAVATNEDVQKLAPRVAADIFIDGELREETLRRHLRNSTRSVVGWIFLSGYFFYPLGQMLTEEVELFHLAVQLAAIAIFGWIARDAWIQRRVLSRLLKEVAPESES